MNPLRELQKIGQSIWLDDIRRSWLEDGTLRRWIEEDGLAGVTSNPSIFEKAIASDTQYDAAIRALAGKGLSPAEVYETLVLEDVRAAADLFRPAYEASAGRDGFVSLEVSPHLANDTEATLQEARRLWSAFDRPNAMIKVPATRAGLAAIRGLIAAGINVNVTLLFGLQRYRQVVDVFLSGLEQRASQDKAIDRVASVASFFISRIDTLVDPRLDAIGIPAARCLRGWGAIAYARLAYATYKEWTASARWQRLAARGGRPQRLLWASTSTKDPAYGDVNYVESLIGPDTIDTLPLVTLDAYRNHGRPEPRLEINTQDARSIPRALQSLGIDLEEAGERLEREGVRKFAEAFDTLLAAIGRKMSAGGGPNG